MPVHHALEFVELSGYGSARMGGHQRIRFLKNLDLEVGGRDVVVVDEVIDTGLTLNYLCRALARRSSTGPTAGSSTTCRSGTSASPSRTSSSPATASTSTGAGATCPTSTWCAEFRHD